MVKSRYLQLLFVLELPPLSLSFSVRPFMFPHSLLPSHAPPSFPVSTKSHRAKLTAAQNPRGLDQGQWFPGHGRSWTKMITPRALIGRWGSQGTGSDESRGRAFMAITRLSAISLPPSPLLLLLSISSVRLSSVFSLLSFSLFLPHFSKPPTPSLSHSFPIPLLFSPPPLAPT